MTIEEIERDIVLAIGHQEEIERTARYAVAELTDFRKS